MKKVFKVLIAIPSCILALLLVMAAVMIVVPLCEHNLPKDKTVDVSSCSDWMSKVDGSKKINELSIPGCHDAGTKYVQLSFFSKCQGETIYQQLNDGYRYVDVRLGAGEDKEGNKVLNLMHGFTFCRTRFYSWSPKLDFVSVVNQCQTFLKENPSETVIFAVKQEHGNETVAEFQQLLNQYMKLYPESLWYTENRLPSLDEVRGKIVLFRRYEDEAGLGNKAGASLIWKNQPGNEDVSLSFAKEDNDECTLYVQDRYEYSAEDKWNAFTSSSEKLSRKCGENDVFINFLSTKGTLVYGHPYLFASKLNRKLMNADCSGFLGWVVIDFGSKYLSSKIYSTNF